MKNGRLGVVAMAALVCVAASQAMAGPVLWDTGEDGIGGVLPNGANEIHYKLYDAADNELPTPVVTYSGAWQPAPAGSQWISLTNPPETAPDALFKYVLEFTLDAIPTEALSGYWMADDATTSAIYLNGANTGNPSAVFWELTPFTITDGFEEGVNRLEFWVSNDLGHAITGLLVSGLGFPEENVVPAPAASLLVALGSCVVGFIRQRRWF